LIVDGQIGYKELDQISFNTSKGYLTNFSYYLEYEAKNIKEQKLNEFLGINLKCAEYSYSEIPKSYFKKMGVTGTLESLHKESLNIITTYEIKQKTLIPSMFGESRREFDKAKNISVEKDKS